MLETKTKKERKVGNHVACPGNFPSFARKIHAFDHFSSKRREKLVAFAKTNFVKSYKFVSKRSMFIGKGDNNQWLKDRMQSWCNRVECSHVFPSNQYLRLKIERGTEIRFERIKRILCQSWGYAHPRVSGSDGGSEKKKGNEKFIQRVLYLCRVHQELTRQWKPIMAWKFNSRSYTYYIIIIIYFFET